MNSSKKDQPGRKVLIDCGASFGHDIIYMLQKFGDALEIYGFECDSRCFADLDKIEKENDNVTILKKAAWIYDGHVNFYKQVDAIVDPDSNWYRDRRAGGSSLLPHKKCKSGMLDVENPDVVVCIDFGSGEEKNFKKEDTIVIDMNVEGAEYELFRNLKEREAVGYINVLGGNIFHNHKVDISTGVDKHWRKYFGNQLCEGGVKKWRKRIKDVINLPLKITDEVEAKSPAITQSDVDEVVLYRQSRPSRLDSDI